MANKLTDEEASYLQRVLTKRWFKDTPFRLDRISFDFVQRGLLELDLTQLAKWCLTPEGEQALQERTSGSWSRARISKPSTGLFRRPAASMKEDSKYVGSVEMYEKRSIRKNTPTGAMSLRLSCSEAPSQLSTTNK